MKRETWGGAIGFILAAAGSAIGLGNIWKFPYVTGMNGGGAFVIVYVLCILLIGIPVMFCEIAIGRKTGMSPVGAIRKLQLKRSLLADITGYISIGLAIVFALYGEYSVAVVSALFGGAMLVWGFPVIGIAMVVCGLIILSYYSVIGAWILAYIGKAFSGNMSMTSPETAKDVFVSMTGNTRLVLGLHCSFMLLCAGMIWGGIKGGIERWSKVLMPALFVLLLLVIIRSVTLPGAMDGIEFFLKPDMSKLTTKSLLEAVGLVFYSLSLGMGITITYGSYLKKEQNVFSAAIWIVVLDLLAAVMSGLAIFPAVFAMGHTPAAGPSLIFQVLPVTFNSFPGGMGWLWAGLFFVMLTIAAVTSGASLLEIGVTALVDKCNLKRKTAVIICFAAVTLLGCLSAVSSSDWQALPWLRDSLVWTLGEEAARGSFLDFVDYLTSNWILPVCGILTCLFVGWVWGADKGADELRSGTNGFADVNLLTFAAGFSKDELYKDVCRNGFTVMTLWALIVRFIAPFVIFIIFLNALGIEF